MNKIFTLLAATTLFAGVAFAQDAPSIISGVTFDVSGQVQASDEDGADIDNCWVLPSVDATVTITLNGYNPELAMDGGWTPYIVWTKGTGYAIDQDFEEPTQTDNSDVYTFTLNKEKWGNPSCGNFYVSVMLCFVNADFDFLMNDDDEPVMFDVSYITQNVFPAEFLYAYPNDEWEDGDTFAKAYKPNNGGCQFNFNNVVNFADNDLMGEIVYTLKDGTHKYVDVSLLGENEIQSDDTIPTGKATVGYSPLDGNYVISVQYWNPNIQADEIASVEITLWDMTSKGVSIEDETASIANNSIVPNVQKMKKSRYTDGIVDSNASVDVYNVHGMLVKTNFDKSNLQSLPAGLYIVDGKKVVIR